MQQSYFKILHRGVRTCGIRVKCGGCGRTAKFQTVKALFKGGWRSRKEKRGDVQLCPSCAVTQ